MPPEVPGSDAPAEVEHETSATLLGFEERDLRLQPGWRVRRIVIASIIFGVVWLGVIALVRIEGTAVASLVLLIPIWALTVVLVARPPKVRAPQRPVLERVAWQAKLIASILLFLLIYIPFAFVSNRIIPFAPLVEYGVFALAIFILYRLIGRSLGVAPSQEALPPVGHRTHQQVVGAIDDPHYQKTVVLNYNFVERGRGTKSLAGRLEQILLLNGVSLDGRQRVLAPIEGESGGLFDRGRRSQRARERRAAALAETLQRFQSAMETSQ